MAIVIAMFTCFAPHAWGEVEDAIPPSAAECPLENVDVPWLLLVPRINGVPASFCAYVLIRERRPYLRVGDWDALGLRLPDTPPVEHKGVSYYPLDEARGLAYRLDQPSQELILEAEPRAFTPTALRHRRAAPASPSPSPPGAFLNYDLHRQEVGSIGTGGALLELGVFGGAGVGTGTFLYRDVPDGHEHLRLETRWTVDRPEYRRRYRFGDSITRSGAWGAPVRFGGVQWGTDFSLDPYFLTTATPTVAGESALPSTVELYVNEMLALRRDLPPGPFEIRDPPVVTGEGEMRLVVRDLLGREQVVTQPYYASPHLLRPGLTEQGYALGWLRQGYAVERDRYGPAFGVATLRHGLREDLTGELRAEVAEDRRTAGIGVSHLWMDWAVLDLELAASGSDAGDGTRLGAGLLRQARGHSFGVQATHFDRHFTQLGRPPEGDGTRYLGRAHAGLSLGRHGTLGAGAVYRDTHEGDILRAYTLSHSRRLGGGFHLSLSLSRTVTDRRTDRVNLGITRRLGPRTSGRAYMSRDGDRRQGVQIQRTPPTDTGLGYRLLAEDGPVQRVEAGIRGHAPAATVTLDAARRDDDTHYRAGLSGGLAYLGGGLFASRRIEDAFAVVRTGQYPHVRVDLENQPVGRSDARGLLLIPRLRAYEAHHIAVEADDLPIDARVPGLSVVAVPRHRSGVLVDFDLRPARGALIRLVLTDGSDVPAGARVRLEGVEETFPVALEGWVYVTGLEDRARLEARWQGRRCSVTVTRPPEAGPLPELGPYVCREEMP